jgi:hypothetical protein
MLVRSSGTVYLDADHRGRNNLDRVGDGAGIRIEQMVIGNGDRTWEHFTGYDAERWQRVPGGRELRQLAAGS